MMHGRKNIKLLISCLKVSISVKYLLGLRVIKCVLAEKVCAFMLQCVHLSERNVCVCTHLVRMTCPQNSGECLQIRE